MTAEELLKQMSVEPFAEEMVCCVIDPETRVIDVPAEYQLLGVESDEKVERMYFQCPKIVGDNIDLSKLALRVNFRNANDQKDQYIVDDVEISGDNITFSWLLSRRVTQYKGNVSFIVCAVKASGEEITNEWNTTLATAQVLEGLEADITLPEEDTDVVKQLIAVATQKITDVQNATFFRQYRGQQRRYKGTGGRQRCRGCPWSDRPDHERQLSPHDYADVCRYGESESYRLWKRHPGTD